MADGALVFGANLNASCLTSRAKKVNNSSISAAANMRRKRQSHRRDIHNRVVLEKVLGITASSSSALTCDPNTGLVAYPAGSVDILYLVVGSPTIILMSLCIVTINNLFTVPVAWQSGHMPCVRVWDVAERTQVAEVQCHKYGVACVSFSPNGSYIVSVGYQHDRTVSVWEWKKGTVIASNKVSSRVLAVSFSEDNSYFVTAGNRHVRFWYLDASKERRVRPLAHVATAYKCTEIPENYYFFFLQTHATGQNSCFCFKMSFYFCEGNAEFSASLLQFSF
uniref:Uncharacterized protein n=1 Tax=Cyprinus carpio TaxID=7962 RepID=A0A8C1V7A3_CYPCA